MLSVPIPLHRANRLFVRPLVRASMTVGGALSPRAIAKHESVLLSGCTEEVYVPIREQPSGLVYNRGLVCGYSPEPINPGETVPMQLS
jgi:UDP-N-acetyl-D-galactosamine dehydrogenase